VKSVTQDTVLAETSAEKRVRVPLGATVDPYQLPASTHEFIHATQATFPLKTSVEGDWQATGVTLADSLRMSNDWLLVLANDKAFIQKYFFASQGDQIQGEIKDGDVERAIDEIAAIACSKYLWGEPDNWPTQNEIDAKHPLLAKAVRKQLAVTVYGVDALKNRPDGIGKTELNTVRRELANLYLGFASTGMSDKGRALLTMALAKGNLNKFSMTNNPDQPVFFKEQTDTNKVAINGIEIENDQLNFKDIVTFRIVNTFLTKYGSTVFPQGTEAKIS
jgi:hypothetical protein